MRPVIDANVVIHGRNSYSFERALTVPEVWQELKSSEARTKASTLEINVENASEDSINRVNDKSSEINAKVSEADIKLAALALEKDSTLITDDKDLQNLASHLNIDFKAFMGDRIEEELEWLQVCSNCGKKVSTPPCPQCGSERVRRKLDQRS
ncbi:MAG: NOB1 family endonuclease [Candidatus Nanohalobium sp.]